MAKKTIHTNAKEGNIILIKVLNELVTGKIMNRIQK